MEALRSSQPLDVADTRLENQVILVIDAAAARRAGRLDDRFDRVVRDLVMGIPVAGCELDLCGITVVGGCSASEATACDAQADLFDYERAH